MPISKLKQAALLSYLGITISIISGIIYTPWMIKTIGTSDYAIFSLAMSIIGFFSIDFGLGPAVAKFLLDYKNNQDKKGYRQFLTTIYRIFWCVSIIASIAFCIFYFIMEDIFIELTSEELDKLKVVYLIAACFALLSMVYRPLDGVLVANERFVFIKSLEVIKKIVTLIAIISLLLLDYGLYSLVFANALVGAFKILAQFIYVRRYSLDASPFDTANINVVRKVFIFSTWIMVVTVAQRFIVLIAPMLLAALSGSNAVAIFSVAMVIEAYSYMLSSAISGLFLPRVSKTLAQDNGSREHLLSLLIKVGRLQLIIFGLVVSGFILLGQEFIHLWVGSDFREVYFVTLLLIIHGVVTFPQEIAKTTLFASGDIKYYAYSVMVVAFFSLLCSFFFIPMFGAIGAALSIAIGQFIGNIVLINYFYIVVLKIDMKSFFVQCHIKIIPAILATLLLEFAFYHAVIPTTWIFFFAKVLIVGITYTLSLWLLSLNNFEKQLFRQLFALIHPIKKRKANVLE